MNFTNPNIRIAHNHDIERAQKKLLFNMICNKENWKNPIECYIPKALYNEFNEAVVYFTAGGLRIVSDDGDYIECQAGGYYVDCGAWKIIPLTFP